MYRIEKPEYLWLLLIIPVIWFVFFVLNWYRAKQRNQAIDSELAVYIIREKSSFKPWLKLFFWSMTMIFLIFALANPQIGTKMETVKRKGADIVFALDVSKSMLAEDVKPNRLAVAKRIISLMIDKMISDRTGIIVYAGEAVPTLPVTTDYAAAKMYLSQMGTGDVSSQGTAIDDAIRLAETYFDRNNADKVLLILSDGEDHGEKALEAAKEAAEQGIKIITVGIGTETGALIPLKRNGQLTGYKTDRNGNRVVTRRNRTLLYRLAQATGGVYIDGNNTREAVKKIEAILKKLNRKEYQTAKVAGYESRYTWFVAVALLFFMLYVLTNERETVWLRKLNLFNENQNAIER